ncbi:MAG TPA: CoA-binding protein [Burkholderiaceae bacterium]
MLKRSVGNFKYFVGIESLAQIATRNDRVCVLNILGGESSSVTPVGHQYSGGNVVFGTSPGRRGQVLQTAIGDIPVYNNVREGLEDGLHFNCGVVYLPPSGARDGVAELIRVNHDLRKIFIVTEKMSVHDAREIRAMGQMNGVDIFGANSLGVVDTWNQVRIGGALGGDSPEQSLKKGSIAIFSNSGGFTTTIASNLRMAGWGTTTLISAGKDVFIHYAAPEFAFALDNDERSKAAVLYSEPGGYYELDAQFTKPIVACVVGRWKSKLTRPVGHAGAMAGGLDDAAMKERWFMEKFGVSEIYTPENPVFSAKGAVVTNIAHIPAALSAVMSLHDIAPDFPPEGNFMALKPWFGSNQGIALPKHINLPIVEAPAPYSEQIKHLNGQLGCELPRQSMKDSSGISQMDPQSQVSRIAGVSVLEAAQYSLESNLCLALLHNKGSANDYALVNVAVLSETNLFESDILVAAEASRAAGNSPNTVLAAACSIVGPVHQKKARLITELLTERFARAGLVDPTNEDFDFGVLEHDAAENACLFTLHFDPKAEAMLTGLQVRGVKSVFLRYISSFGKPVNADAVLAAIATTLAWKPLMRKQISVISAYNLPWWLKIFGALIGASSQGKNHKRNHFCEVPQFELFNSKSITEIGYSALLGNTPTTPELFAFQSLIGLLLTNGPGTISAQGAKGAVSADGPESPERVQLNKAMIGFLTHSGFAHGGNGYEGISFLIKQFKDSGLTDPADPDHGLDLKAMASNYVSEYAAYKAIKKTSGNLNVHKIPGVNHPVFKDKPVNHDPREVFLRTLFQKKGEYNVFIEYYHVLVQELYDRQVSRNVYCVNIDAVIAALLLRMLWGPYKAGIFPESALETAAFNVFLYGRMLGCAAEIDDHINRGRNMDMRTPLSACISVS